MTKLTHKVSEFKVGDIMIDYPDNSIETEIAGMVIEETMKRMKAKGIDDICLIRVQLDLGIHRIPTKLVM